MFVHRRRPTYYIVSIELIYKGPAKWKRKYLKFSETKSINFALLFDNVDIFNQTIRNSTNLINKKIISVY